MIRNLLRDESGYSLVEVIVSIMLLSIAIIPMVGMFDVGLRAASTSGNYDKARTFANQQLEEAKSMKYEDAKNTFPVSGSVPSPSWGPGPSPSPSVAGLPGGSYTVEKRYIDQLFANASSDTGMIKVTVTVSWGSGNSYTTTGVVGK